MLSGGGLFLEELREAEEPIADAGLSEPLAGCTGRRSLRDAEEDMFAQQRRSLEAVQELAGAIARHSRSEQWPVRARLCREMEAWLAKMGRVVALERGVAREVAEASASELRAARVEAREALAAQRMEIEQAAVKELREFEARWLRESGRRQDVERLLDRAQAAADEHCRRHREQDVRLESLREQLEAGRCEQLRLRGEHLDALSELGECELAAAQRRADALGEGCASGERRDFLAQMSGLRAALAKLRDDAREEPRQCRAPASAQEQECRALRQALLQEEQRRIDEVEGMRCQLQRAAAAQAAAEGGRVELEEQVRSQHAEAPPCDRAEMEARMQSALEEAAAQRDSALRVNLEEVQQRLCAAEAAVAAAQDEAATVQDDFEEARGRLCIAEATAEAAESHAALAQEDSHQRWAGEVSRLRHELGSAEDRCAEVREEHEEHLQVAGRRHQEHAAQQDDAMKRLEGDVEMWRGRLLRAEAAAEDRAAAEIVDLRQEWSQEVARLGLEKERCAEAQDELEAEVCRLQRALEEAAQQRTWAEGSWGEEWQEARDEHEAKVCRLQRGLEEAAEQRTGEERSWREELQKARAQAEASTEDRAAAHWGKEVARLEQELSSSKALHAEALRDCGKRARVEARLESALQEALGLRDKVERSLYEDLEEVRARLHHAEAEVETRAAELEEMVVQRRRDKASEAAEGTLARLHLAEASEAAAQAGAAAAQEQWAREVAQLGQELHVAEAQRAEVEQSLKDDLEEARARLRHADSVEDRTASAHAELRLQCSQEVARLELELCSLQALHAELSDERDAHLRAEAALREALEAALAEQHKAKESSNDELGGMRARLVEAEAAEAEMEDREAAAHVHLRQEWAGEVAGLEQELDSARLSHAEAASDREANSEVEAKLRKQLEDAVALLRGELEAAVGQRSESLMEDMRARQAATEAHAAVAQGLREEWAAEVARLAQELQSAKALHAEALDEAMAQRSNGEQSLNEDVENMRARLQQAEVAAAAAEDRAAADQADLRRQCAQEITRLEQEVQSAKALHAEALRDRGELAQAEAELQHSLEEATGLREQVEKSLNDALQDMQERLHRAEAGEAEAAERASMVQDRAVLLEEEVQSAQALHAEAASDRDQHVEARFELQHAFEEATRRRDELEISSRHDLDDAHARSHRSELAAAAEEERACNEHLRAASLEEQLESLKALHAELTSDRDVHAQVGVELREALQDAVAQRSDAEQSLHTDLENVRACLRHAEEAAAASEERAAVHQADLRQQCALEVNRLEQELQSAKALHAKALTEWDEHAEAEVQLQQELGEAAGKREQLERSFKDDLQDMQVRLQRSKVAAAEVSALQHKTAFLEQEVQAANMLHAEALRDFAGHAKAQAELHDAHEEAMESRDQVEKSLRIDLQDMQERLQRSEAEEAAAAERACVVQDKAALLEQEVHSAEALHAEVLRDCALHESAKIELQGALDDAVGLRDQMEKALKQDLEDMQLRLQRSEVTEVKLGEALEDAVVQRGEVERSLNDDLEDMRARFLRAEEAAAAADERMADQADLRQQCEREVKRLGQELESTKVAHAGALGDCDEHAQAQAELQHELKEARRWSEQVERSLNGDLQDMQERLRLSEMHAAAASERARAVQDKAALLEQEVLSLKALHAEVARDCASHESAKIELQGALEDAAGLRHQMEKAVQQDLEDMQLRLQQSEVATAVAAERSSELREQVVSLEHQLASIEALHADALSDLDVHAQAEVALREAFEDAQVQRGEVEKSLNDNLEDMRRRLHKAEVAVAAAENRAAVEQADLRHQCAHKVDRLEQELQSAKALHAEALRHCDEHAKAKVELQHDLEDAIEIREQVEKSWKDDVQDMQARLQRSEVAAAAAAERASEVQDEATDLQDRLASLKALHVELVRDRDVHAHAEAALREALEDAVAQREKVEKSLNDDVEKMKAWSHQAEAAAAAAESRAAAEQADLRQQCAQEVKRLGQELDSAKTLHAEALRDCDERARAEVGLQQELQEARRLHQQKEESLKVDLEDMRGRLQRSEVAGAEASQRACVVQDRVVLLEQEVREAAALRERTEKSLKDEVRDMQVRLHQSEVAEAAAEMRSSALHDKATLLEQEMHSAKALHVEALRECDLRAKAEEELQVALEDATRLRKRTEKSLKDELRDVKARLQQSEAAEAAAQMRASAMHDKVVMLEQEVLSLKALHAEALRECDARGKSEEELQNALEQGSALREQVETSLREDLRDARACLRRSEVAEEAASKRASDLQDRAMLLEQELHGEKALHAEALRDCAAHAQAEVEFQDALEAAKAEMHSAEALHAEAGAQMREGFEDAIAQRGAAERALLEDLEAARARLRLAEEAAAAAEDRAAADRADLCQQRSQEVAQLQRVLALAREESAEASESRVAQARADARMLEEVTAQQEDLQRRLQRAEALAEQRADELQAKSEQCWQRRSVDVARLEQDLGDARAAEAAALAGRDRAQQELEELQLRLGRAEVAEAAAEARAAVALARQGGPTPQHGRGADAAKAGMRRPYVFTACVELPPEFFRLGVDGAPGAWEDPLMSGTASTSMGAHSSAASEEGDRSRVPSGEWPAGSDAEDGEEELPGWAARTLRQIQAEGWSSMAWKDGHTLLHWAAERNRPRLCQALLALGAEPSAPDASGKSAVDVARERRSREALDVLWASPCGRGAYGARARAAWPGVLE